MSCDAGELGFAARSDAELAANLHRSENPGHQTSVEADSGGLGPEIG